MGCAKCGAETAGDAKKNLMSIRLPPVAAEGYECPARSLPHYVSTPF